MTLIRKNSADFMPGLFNDMFGKNWMESASVRNNVPAVNVKENENGFQLEMAAPGMDKKNFNIQLDKNVLTISYEKKAEKSEEDKGYTRKEFLYNSFQRAFVLPETVDTEKISADYKNGILKVDILKKEEAKEKAPRSIKIS